MHAGLRILLVGCLLALFSTPAVYSQGQPRGGGQELTLRTYPVGDIVFQVADYSVGEGPASKSPETAGGGGFRGGGFGVGGGAFSVPDPGLGAAVATQPPFRFAQRRGGQADQAPTSSAITVESLLLSITSCIAPASWSGNGGDAQITVLGSLLVISQSQEVHGQIEGFLAMVRRNAGGRRTMSIDARWLLLNSEELDRLLIPGGQGAPLVETKALEEFTRRATSLRAITNCFSGQLVHVVSGTDKSIVSSWIPVVGRVDWRDPTTQLVHTTREQASFRLVSDTLAVRESKVGYQPILTSLNLGVVLEIRPMLVQGDDIAIVDLSSKLNFSTGDAPLPPPNPASLTPAVDRVSLETARLATTLMAPLGKPVLVGGLSYAPAAAMERAKASEERSKPAAESRQAYLVLKVR